MIKIVTDSTAGLPEAMIREHDIRVVPLYVHFGEQAFREGVEISNEQFYERLAKSAQLPTTSQPSPGEFYEVFKDLSEAGHEIVTLTISSKLSGTWNSAMAAQEMLPDAPISVVDSLSTSAGMYLMIEAALEAIAAGATRQQVADLLEQMKDQVHIMFVVDTLEYLAKGGRIGNAKAWVGTVLKIKPILILQEGVIEPCEQVRSKRKALTRMQELIEQRLGGQGQQSRLAIVHGIAPDGAQAMKGEIVARLRCPEPRVSEVGPVLGTHTGPGVIGVGAYVQRGIGEFVNTERVSR
jgi:DegV family protein with EDD domain